MELLELVALEAAAAVAIEVKKVLVVQAALLL